MEKLILSWLDIWLYVILAIGIIDGVLLAVNWKKYNPIMRLSVIGGITLVAHVWEEWVLPGGFGYIYNDGCLNYPMNRLSDMTTNLMGVLTISVIGFYWAYRTFKGKSINQTFVTRTGICVFLISVLEGFMHIKGGINYLDTYGFYNPGRATTIFMFLPIAVFFFISFRKNKPTKKDWLIGAIATMVVVLVMIILPEAIFKDPNSPFGYPNAGWYQQFLE